MKSVDKIYPILLIVIIITMMFTIAACSTKTPAKNVSKNTINNSGSICSTDNDCAILLNKTLKRCTTPFCTAGACKIKVTNDCCGNNITEQIENGKPGNKCTCPLDYGICNATVRYADSTGKMIVAKYITRLCDANEECSVSYDEQAQRNTDFFNIWIGAGFTINVYAMYPNPFFKSDSSMNVEFKLTDYDGTRIQLPVIINEIRIMEGSTILDRTDPNIVLTSLGENESSIITMANYDYVYPEESKTVTISIDYEYTPVQKVTDPVTKTASYVPLDQERKTYTVPLKDKLVFLDKSLISG